VKLTNVTSRTLSSIVADPVVGAWGFHAYVGSSNCGCLLVVGQRGWWQVALDVKGSEEEHVNAVGTATLALSRREALLYLTAPESHVMFSMNLSAVRSSPPPSNKVSCLSSFRKMSRYHLGFSHHRFLLNNFQLIFHESFYHSTLYSPSH
jgi:hypothetical protein